MRKDTFYFSHDSNARHDPKIVAMRCIYGYEGYGWYWAILEILREDKEFILPLTKYQLMGLAKDLETNIDMLNKFLNDCIEIGLLNVAEDETKNKHLHCVGLTNRMMPYLKKSKQAKEAALIRWDRSKNDANAMRTHNERYTNAMQSNQIKSNQIKSNNTITQQTHSVILSQWNSFCEKHKNLAKVNTINSTRKSKLKIRLKEEEFNFGEIIIAIEEQPFLINGNENSTNHSTWKVSFDWLITNDSNYIKVLERTYGKSIEKEIIHNNFLD